MSKTPFAVSIGRNLDEVSAKAFEKQRFIDIIFRWGEICGLCRHGQIRV
jgi:hypothetical protein